MKNDHGMLSANRIIQEVAEAMPAGARSSIVVVGSLATAYAFSTRVRERLVRTKDIDCVLSPHTVAVEHGRAIAQSLLDHGWKPLSTSSFATAGNASTADSDLPAIRLQPPTGAPWFVELLTESDRLKSDGRQWKRVVLSGDRHYGLPSFPFTGVSTFDAQPAPSGVRVAGPAQMALAHLLEHRAFRDDIIESTRGHAHPQLRRNKDLGRAVAIAWLSGPDSYLRWVEPWRRALKTRFPEQAAELASSLGLGLRRLVQSPVDLEQSRQIANLGLLAGGEAQADEFENTAKRLLTLVVEPMEHEV